MPMNSRTRAAIFLIVISTILSIAAVAEDGLTRVVTGVVKHVDHEGKKMIVKAGDGTEHTIQYGEETGVTIGKSTQKGIADVWLASKEGAKVTVRYTDKAGEASALVVKDAVVKMTEQLK